MRIPTSESSCGVACRAVAGSHTRRPAGWRILMLVALALAGVLALGTSSAQALQVHTFSFGASGTAGGDFSSPQGLAVDQATGDVYVVDAGNFRVEKFTPDLATKKGNFDRAFGANVGGTGVNVCTSSCQAGTQGASAGAFETPQFIAVDNSTGASAGDVYVSDPGDDTVSKFDSSGNLITSFATGGQLNGAATSTFATMDGITVDSGGNLWVIDSNNALWEFSPSGSSITNFPTTRGMSPSGLDIGNSGNFFKVNGDGSVEEVTSAGADIGSINEGATSTTEIAIDRASGDLYQDLGTSVDHYQFNSAGAVDEVGGTTCPVVPSGSCSPTDSFGSPVLSDGTGVAYDSTESAAYVADAGNDDVAVFGPPSPGAPEIDGESASGIGSTYATLNGLVNPFGVDTTCKFEYVTDADFTTSGYTDATTVPCTPSDLGSSFEDQAASADLPYGTLTINTEYHFRVVATNTDGTTTGNDTTFTTLGPASIDSESAPNVGNTTATLNAQINPLGTDTTCTFQYVTDANFTSSGYTDATTVPCAPSDLGAGTSDVSAGANLANLAVSTTYHFRAVAANTLGTQMGTDQTFTTLGPASIDSESAPNVGNTTATLNAQINPLGTDTTCVFEYVTDADFTSSGYTDATTVPCTPSDLGAGSSDVSTSANITGLAVSTLYHFRVVATNTLGTETGSDQTFMTLGPASIDGESATMVGTNHATINAEINPLGTDTTCTFQYVTDADFMSSGYTDATTVPCAPSDLGSGQGDVAASATLTGLQLGTTYHFQAIATNALGSVTGSVQIGDQTFTTTSTPASVDSVSVAAVTDTSARLKAQINPQGGDTTYQFEYWTGSSCSGTDGVTLPAIPVDIGSGTSDVPASVDLTGLSPDKPYSFQAQANGIPGPQCDAFTTFAALGATGLPDGRAYELVSPDATAGGDVSSVLCSLIGGSATGICGGDQAAPTGDGMAYAASSSFPGSTGAGDNYVATRTASGWSTQPLLPPQEAGNTLEIPGFIAFSSDLSKGVLVDGGGDNGGFAGQDDPPLVPGTCTTMTTPVSPCSGEAVGVQNLFVLNTSTGSPQLVNHFNSDAPAGFAPAAASLAGNSADMSTLVFDESAPLTATAPTSGPVLYEWNNGTVSLIGGGATLGGAGRVLNAISSDGSRIFFTNSGGDLEVEHGGTATQIDAPASGAPGPGGGGQFMTAATDGSEAFLTDGPSAGLTSDTMTGSGQNLYRYDAATGASTDLTGGQSDATVDGVVGASADGSYVYFVAQGALSGTTGATAGQENLYVNHTPDPSANPSSHGTTTFIAALNSGDSSDWNGGYTARVTPDGTHLAFDSISPLTGYNNTDANTGSPDTEIFLFNATSDSLICASCNPTGTEPIGSSFLDPVEVGLESSNYGGGNEYLQHNLSDDGSRLFFDSNDALSPRDTDGTQDVYEWENGQLSLISSGTSETNSTFYDASSNGSDAFFVTRQQLVPQDTNADRYALYDARVGGGFAAPVSVPPCTGDACKPPQSTPPPVPTLATVSFVGPGNPKPGSGIVRVAVTAKALKGFRFSLRLLVPGKGKVTISGAGVRTVTKSFKRAGSYTVTVTLTAAMRKALNARHKRKLTLTVRVRYKPATGNSSSVTVSVTVRR